MPRAGSTTYSRSGSRPPSRAPTATTNRPGTAKPPQTEKDDGDWVVAIIEGRGTGREVGVAALERNHLQVILTQFNDTATCVKTLHLLTTRPPSIILIPSTFVSNKNKPELNLDGSGTVDQDASLLTRSLQDTWRDVPIVPVPRKFWVDSKGYEFISVLIIVDDQRTATLLSSKSKFYALCALCALFKYLESSHHLHFHPRSLRILYCALEGTCLIDTDTANNLELVANLINKNSKQHLLGLINHCYTPMATRLLRTNILGPCADVETIDLRLNAVEELVGSEELFHSVRKSLEGLKKLDLDKLIGQIVNSRSRSLASSSDPARDAEHKITRILSLRTLLLSLSSLRSSLLQVDSHLLRSILLILQDEKSDAMLEAIGRTINEDAVSSFGQKGAQAGAGRNARIYAVRSERKMLLNVARETYKENVQDAFELGDLMKEKYGIEVSLAYSNSGYSFTCLASQLDEKELPKVFTNVTRKGKKLEFSSLDLKKRNARITESVQETFVLSDEIMDELFDEVREDIACLYRCSEAIAMLDMLAAFADVATKYNYVRPEFTEVLAIKNGRHPLHERFRMSDGSFVPNDTYANDDSNFQIVGGSNMSGKSTLLRQIALMHIMAQIGCYVPADYASFRCIDTLLSRLSNDDNLSESMSTFSQEMSTMAMIVSVMQMPDTHCLIIVDELGRGTSPLEGVGIAHALSEAIIKSKAICFFATHFKELTTTLSNHPNVVSLHLDTSVDATQSDFSLTFHHRCVDGPSKLSHYGLELAKVVKLPPDVLGKATEVAHTLEELATEGHMRAQATQLTFRRQELLRLRTMLKARMQGKPELMDPEQILEDLRNQQEETTQVLASTMESLSVATSERRRGSATATGSNETPSFKTRTGTSSQDRSSSSSSSSPALSQTENISREECGSVMNEGEEVDSKPGWESSEARHSAEYERQDSESFEPLSFSQMEE